MVEGRVKEVADYCETDAVNTYRGRLRYELFRGRLTEVDYTTQARSASSEFINRRVDARMRPADVG